MYIKDPIKSECNIFNCFLSIIYFFEIYTYYRKELLNAGKDCWGGCGRRQGPCEWCGSGLCCRKGWWDTRNGCDGSIGENGKGHVCAPGITLTFSIQSFIFHKKYFSWSFNDFYVFFLSHYSAFHSDDRSSGRANNSTKFIAQ